MYSYWTNRILLTQNVGTVQAGNISCELEIQQYKNTDTSLHAKIFKSSVSTI